MRGWTYPDIDALTFADAREVLEHIRGNPPLVDCVRAYLGIETRNPSTPNGGNRDVSPTEVTPEQFEALVQESKRFSEKFKTSPMT